MNSSTLIRTIAMLIAMLLVLPLLAQEPVQNVGGVAELAPTTEESTASSSPSTTAESLRNRIRGMRMDLLLGGEKVRAAEDEASDFYGRKIGLVDERLDGINADLAEIRASYDLKLETALKSSTPQDRRKIMAEAAQLRSQITSLEQEASNLDGKRGKLNTLIDAIGERDRDRQKLATKMETSDALDFEFGLPLAGVGLAPDIPAEQSSPLANQELVQDLLKVDPRGGRQVLFEMDPLGYWDLFPLRPPSGGVVAALAFPLPDLEGGR